MNYLYELGTANQVIIRPFSARRLNGVNYEAGEPYTTLKDVDITLVYSDLGSEINTNRTLNKRQNITVQNVMITNVDLTSKILALMATKQEDTQGEVTRSYTTRSDDGETLYLNDVPNADTLYVYDSSGNRIAVTVEGAIVSGEFLPDTNYLVFYKVFVEQDIYSLDVPQYGYFSIEAVGVGNKDKLGTSFYLNFPTVSLLPQPQAIIDADGLFGSALDFAVVAVTGGDKPTIAI